MKTTIEGTEYNVVPVRTNRCFVEGTQCAFYARTNGFCDAQPCRAAPVIFLTDEALKQLITERLSQ